MRRVTSSSLLTQHETLPEPKLGPKHKLTGNQSTWRKGLSALLLSKLPRTARAVSPQTGVIAELVGHLHTGHFSPGVGMGLRVCIMGLQ